MSCGIFLEQASNSCLLHRQANSLPPSHQKSPYNFILKCNKSSLFKPYIVSLFPWTSSGWMHIYANPASFGTGALDLALENQSGLWLGHLAAMHLWVSRLTSPGSRFLFVNCALGTLHHALVLPCAGESHTLSTWLREDRGCFSCAFPAKAFTNGKAQ